MTSNAQISRRGFLGAGASIGLLAAAAAACSKGSSTSSSGGAVKISTADLPSAQTSPASRKLFLADVAAFNAMHKGKITLTAHEYTWANDTFAARLASGQLETTFQIPFTEPATLIARRQAGDVTKYTSSVPHYSSLNPQLTRIPTVNNKIYGIPTGGYAEGLVYNRAVFAKAGLDPDKPPTTWDEVRDYARTIVSKGAAPAGFAMPTQMGYGGWYFTMMNYSFGGSEEKSSGGKTVVSFPDDTSQAVMQLLHDMRWTDKSMGKNGVQQITDVQKAMAAGQLGMFTAAGDNLNSIVIQFGGKPADIGMGPYPQKSGNNSTLTGGTLSMFNVKASPDELKAALQWVGYHYLRQFTEASAAQDVFAAAAKDKSQVIGYPTLPVVTGSAQADWVAAQQKYATVPASNFTAYNQWITGAKLVPEPKINAQAVYAALDAAVQKVLTQQSADVTSALKSAASQANTALSQTPQ